MGQTRCRSPNAVFLGDEAETLEFEGSVVVCGIAHHGLRGDADDVAGGDFGAVGEGEGGHDFASHGVWVGEK